MSSSDKSIDYIINNITKDITDHINSQNFLKMLKKDKEFLKYTNNIHSYDNISTESCDSDSSDVSSRESYDSDSSDVSSTDTKYENVNDLEQKKIIKKLTPVFLFFILKIVKKKYHKPTRNLVKKYTYNGKQFKSNKNI